jgi:pimeloyl-ACP methyl ester carboxylesterase
LDRFYFRGANAQISALAFGEPDSPPVVMIHGMRDHALGFMPLIEALQKDHYVLVADLRGHGQSEKTGTYTMIQFVADVRGLFLEMKVDEAIVVGHSLGGHIALRFAAVFPEMVKKLVLLDGMGPPGLDSEPDKLNQRFREGVATVLGITGERRQIPSEVVALERLKSNNPGMPQSLAELVVREGVEPHPEGGVRWRWESAINMVWQTFSQVESESLISTVRCPVLIVTGEHGLQYWISMRPQYDDAEFYQRELDRRTALFANAQHVVIPGAGHMLHYDQPELVIKALTSFFAE